MPVTVVVVCGTTSTPYDQPELDQGFSVVDRRELPGRVDVTVTVLLVLLAVRVAGNDDSSSSSRAGT